jgi:hypothetical protein
VKSSGQKSVSIGCVDETFGDGNSSAKFLLHKISHFGEVDLFDKEYGRQFVSDIIQFLIHSLEMLLMKVGDIDEVVNFFLLMAI